MQRCRMDRGGHEPLRLHHTAAPSDQAVASPRLEPALLAVTAAALTTGGAAWLAGDEGLADLLWGLGTLSAVPPAVGRVVTALRQALRAST